DMGWPDYNRLLHNPVEDATFVDGEVVILEGNYLLLDVKGWRDLSHYADYTIRILAEEEDLKERLVERKIASGTPRGKAEEFVERSDLYNARLVLQHSLSADLILKTGKNGNYHVLSL
ncbi:MAG: hypothetical protein KBS81_10880, partial [Spirochaetales bacterium]|nr:hypothetical protein [Candidatus Physcosoma equi]